jgi:hypothetical protein
MIALAVMVATPSSLIDDELYRNQISTSFWSVFMGRLHAIIDMRIKAKTSSLSIC